jgi:tRNA A37 threonylcarbamoyladenosine synthetase subunit TsaC/SUA5/YrdC
MNLNTGLLIKIIRRGGVGVLPTDALYGLLVRPSQKKPFNEFIDSGNGALKNH